MDRARQRGRETEANMSVHTKEILLYMTWTLNLTVIGVNGKLSEIRDFHGKMIQRIRSFWENINLFQM